MPATTDFAFLTCKSFATLQADYHDVLVELERRGYSCSVEIWNDQRVDWSAYRSAVICSIWDYYENISEFRAFLERTQSACRLINTPPVVHWNLNKRYLKELEKKGVPVIETLWIDSVDQLSHCQWKHVVLKPSIGAGSFGMLKVDLPGDQTVARKHVEALLEDGRGPVMAQPHLKSLANQGETVLIYFDGKLSHCVARPLAGHQGSIEAELSTSSDLEPQPDELEVGKRVIGNLPFSPVYARVDLSRDDNGRPVLLELELIEPTLFLCGRKEAVDNYATALERAFDHRYR